jgi:ABC-type transport system substrate-binding protein
MGYRKASEMIANRRAVAAACALIIAITTSGMALAQKAGGILTMYIWDNPPSMSMLDGVNPLAQRATMGVFNNLVMFDQHVKQSSLQSIVPDLSTSWSWNEEGTALTLPLRQGVKWHDGKPFTAKDVQCTWDLVLDKSSDKLRVNTIKSWYRNLAEVTTNGDYEVTFHLKRPQPAFLMLLANGFAPVYPCHVPAAQMRQHPIGTGPFKFVVDQGDAKCGLLEEGSALSRRDRIYDHKEHVDGDIGVYFRKVRHDLSEHPHGTPVEGRADPDAAGDLRVGARWRHQPPLARQPRQAAFR